MPNGWYPVPGLDIVLLNRTEQRSPRFEWRQSWPSMWAARMFGARGYSPTKPMPTITSDKIDFFDLVEAVGTLITEDYESAAVLTVDFDARRGAACGSFVAYGFESDGVEVIHEHSLEAEAIARGVPQSEREKISRYRNIVTSSINHEGLQNVSEDPKYTFDFSGFDRLVISSHPLHHDPHWPPSSLLDVPAVALAQDDGRDVLLALWQAPSE